MKNGKAKDALADPDKKRITSIDVPAESKKRKSSAKHASAKRRAGDSTNILELETQVAESRKHYNNIAVLLSMLGGSENDEITQFDLSVAISLCRVFCRLLAGGHMNKHKNAGEKDQIVVAWLRERYHEYQDALLAVIRSGTVSQQTTATTLALRLTKEQATHLPGSETQVWTGYFGDVLAALVQAEDDAPRAEFVGKFVNAFHDIAVYTVSRLSEQMSTPKSPKVIDACIFLLSEIGSPPAEQTFDPAGFYVDPTKAGSKTISMLTSLHALKRRVQEAWMGVLQQPLSTSQRKALLRITAHQVAPWFTNPELLLDFLTDSVSGSDLPTALLALQGLFYLMRTRNVDYPQFYQRLYALVTPETLHSKHRSRFLRLLAASLSSSHLPAALVASFIKRLSVLSLSAPPAAIVAIAPLAYNLFQLHPATTPMMHRESAFLPPPYNDRAYLEAHGWGWPDPFDAAEPDPALTGAIDSCIWELVTLMNHYHPTVASIVRILGQPFTKPSYNLEDFLDHSYASMTESALGRDDADEGGMSNGKGDDNGDGGDGNDEDRPGRKAPVVEYRIPKRIFTDRKLDEDGGPENDKEPFALVRRLWDFS